jgi:hypothetical protein
VINIDRRYREFVEANRPKKHYHALSATFLRGIADEGLRRGEKLTVYSPSLCFTLRVEPPVIPLPDGFSTRIEDAAWMNAEMQQRRFENGVGEPGVDGRDFRNRYALVLSDAGGEIAAVAGAFETYGMMEIGVDVERRHRGRGLGLLVVSAMAREIVRRGEIPFYGCGATNIRSHRTAEAAGFGVVCSDALVSTPA